MGHAEDDKELMMIRMETLKTMIGKLKNKTNQSTSKETGQSSSTDEKRTKGHCERTKPVCTTRSATSTTPISPQKVVAKSNKIYPGTTTPPSPKRDISTNVSPLQKTRTKQNQSQIVSTGHLSSSSVGSIALLPVTTYSLNPLTPFVPAATSLPLSATSLRILKVNSLIQIPKVKSNIQTDVTDGKSPAPAPTVPTLVDHPSLNKNCTILTRAVVNSSKPLNMLSSIKPELIKPVTKYSKSYSDSEIPLRKSLHTKLNSNNECVPPACIPAFVSVVSKCSPVYSRTVRPASTEPVGVSLKNDQTRPSSLLLSHSSLKSIQTGKAANRMQEHNSSSVTVQKSNHGCSTTVTNMKSVNKTSSVSRPPTHTITKPDTHRKPNSVMSSTGSAPTKTKLSNITVASESKLSKKSIPPQTGKVLFERKGKVLFDRHADTQNKLKFQAHSVGTITSNQTSLSRTKPRANFAHEFQLIREKHVSSHVNTTRTKFFSAEYTPPETCCKARVILSKYKVVWNKDNNNVAISSNKTNEGSVRSSQTTTTSSSPNVADVPGKILFQRHKPTYARDYTRVQSKKVGRYSIKKIHGRAHTNFVSRRLKYIKQVDHNPYQMQVGQPVAISGSPNGKVTKEIILSRHGTSYKVSGNLKSLRRLSSEKVRSSKFIPKSTSKTPKPIILHTKHKLLRSTSKLGTRSVSAKQYAASQVLKKTMVQTARKKVTNEKYCLFYNRFGKCKRGDQCNFIHDADKIAICTRFVRGTCKDENCLFSHKLDPDKMPVCSYFLRGECSRDNCPYRHVKVSQSASVCDDFLKGYCPRGKECTKKHILECEEFITTGSCSKGNSCPLTHRQGKLPKRRNSGSRPPKGIHQKRKKGEENNEDVAMNGENSNENESESSRENKAKKHKLPKFVSEKIKLLRESTSVKPASFAGIKKLMESTTPTDKTSDDDAKSPPSKDDIWNSDFIPLSNYSGGESDDEDSEFIQRMFTFK